jgi:hypothetical protein
VWVLLVVVRIEGCERSEQDEVGATAIRLSKRSSAAAEAGRISGCRGETPRTTPAAGEGKLSTQKLSTQLLSRPARSPPNLTMESATTATTPTMEVMARTATSQFQLAMQSTTNAKEMEMAIPLKELATTASPAIMKYQRRQNCIACA